MSREPLFASLESAIAELDIAPRSQEIQFRPGRRSAAAVPPDAIAMRIVEHDGVLYVDEGQPPRALAGPRRRRGPRPAGVRGEDREMLLRRLEPSKVAAALRKLDVTCNGFLAPDANALGRLRRVAIGARSAADPAPDGSTRTATLEPHEGTDGEIAGGSDRRILLLVHGTFSNSNSFFDNFAALPANDRDALYGWMSTYDQVLAFDHPTLAVSPAINARRLHEEIGDLRDTHVDVVCHSRGGLVTRWWLEAFDAAPPGKRRAVFVGCPLHGTGLAAPANLRGTLSLLLNVADAAIGLPLRVVGATVPFGSIVSQLFRIVSSVTSLAIRSPALDAAIALVPGVAAMSRTTNNYELDELRRPVAIDGRYFFVQSNFEPDDPHWRFWQRFRKGQLLNAAADTVFDGANDLVVDTDSMTDLATLGTNVPASQVLDFGQDADARKRVYHTNYFTQPETAAKLRHWLK